MSEPITPDPSTATQPPAAAAPPPAPSPAPTLATTPADQLDPEKLRALVLTQRENEATLAAENAALKAKADELDALKAAQMTEQERIVAERDTARAEAATAADTLKQAYLLVELSKPEHGIVDAEAAAALITGVEYGTDGRPANAAERIGALLEAKGFLKASTAPAPPPPAPAINGAAGTTPAAAPNLSPEEVRMAEQLGKTPEEYAALKDVRSLADYTQLQAAKQAATT